MPRFNLRSATSVASSPSGGAASKICSGNCNRRPIAREHGATEAFWKQVAQEGTPLVEPFGTDGKYQLVTFLWRATFDTRNVLVSGSFDVPEQNRLDFVMHRLADTDVWRLTLKLPKGARFSYRLSPNDPLVLNGPRAE